MTAGVETFLLTTPKALRPDGRGVVKVLAVIGDFRSFSLVGEKTQVIAYFSQTVLVLEENKQSTRFTFFIPGADLSRCRILSVGAWRQAFSRSAKMMLAIVSENTRRY